MVINRVHTSFIDFHLNRSQQELLKISYCKTLKGQFLSRFILYLLFEKCHLRLLARKCKYLKANNGYSPSQWKYKCKKKILVSILTCLLCASLIALESNQILFKYTFLSIGSKKWNFCPIENRFRGGGDACFCFLKKSFLRSLK